MGTTIRNIRIWSFIIILIEILLLTAFFIIYFNNFFNAQTAISSFWIIIGAASIVVIDCLFVWISVIRINHVRNKTDLTAARIIGSDVQEAYNFGMIGLAVTDENNTIIWTNELFRQRHIDIVDKNILEWQPDLTSLTENPSSDKTAKIAVNSRNYDVKYLEESDLWIFKDNTDYESLFAYSKQQAPVVGLLSIDNYEDLVRGGDDINDVMTRLKNLIFNYAKEYGILLKKHRDDNYLLLCNYESFNKMKKDKFSIIDKAREVSRDEEIPLTLSIGIAHDFPDVVKLNEMASNALDIAMSRGGDQVVISAYGSEMEFVGGKTSALQKRNRVRTRVLADSLVSLIRNASDVLVMGHTMLDMDALGACLGVTAIAKRLEKPCHVVIDLKQTESKTHAALLSQFSKDEIDDLVYNSDEALNHLNTETLLIVVDVHIPSMTMAPKLLLKATKTVVIDHHRRAEEYIESPVFNHIDSSASSTCEIIAEFLRFSSISPRVELPESFATIMLSGIFLDSSYFKNKATGVRTFEASTILKEYGADNAEADDLLKDDYEEFKEINFLLSDLKTPEYGVVYAKGEEDKEYDPATIAKASNACITMKGVEASFVFAKINQKEVRLSCRSNGLINVQLIAEKLCGGGHFTSAAASFKDKTIDEVEILLKATLASALKEAKADAKSRKDLD